ncbi:hypothetical protein QCA50_020197 [Cerrena zonata]|uniref:Uncharacterized protein n=1 Tax=Cerrena zonata TaxID=2478898 RepID=A0AAW0FHQ8_9APHY
MHFVHCWDTQISGVFENSSHYGAASVRCISDYHQQLQYREEGTRDHSYRIDDLQQCLITKLEVFKYNSLHDHEHELVLAHIEYNNGEKPQRQYFRLERDSNPASFHRRTRPPHVQVGLHRESGDTDTRRGGVKNDWIILHADLGKPEPDLKLKGNSHLCYTVSFSGPDYPTILDLSSAARTLSDVAPHYIAFEHMCYWFSHNLCRVLSLGRRYKIKMKAQDAGHWKGVPVINGFGQLILAAFMPAASDARDLEEARQNTTVVDGDSSLESISPIFSKGCFTHSEQIIEMWKRYRGVFEQMVNNIQAGDNCRLDKRRRLMIEETAIYHAKADLNIEAVGMSGQEKELYGQIQVLVNKLQANPDIAESRELLEAWDMCKQRFRELEGQRAENRYQLTRAKLAIEAVQQREKEAMM